MPGPASLAPPSITLLGLSFPIFAVNQRTSGDSDTRPAVAGPTSGFHSGWATPGKKDRGGRQKWGPPASQQADPTALTLGSASGGLCLPRLHTWPFCSSPLRPPPASLHLCIRSREHLPSEGVGGRMGRRSSCVPPAQDPGGCSRQDVLPLAQMLPSVSGKGMEGLGGPPGSGLGRGEGVPSRSTALLVVGSRLSGRGASLPVESRSGRHLGTGHLNRLLSMPGRAGGGALPHH